MLRQIGQLSIVNWKGYGRKCLWPDLRYYPVIFLEMLGKAPETSVGIFAISVDIRNELLRN
jgi:hypothetical protein